MSEAEAAPEALRWSRSVAFTWLKALLALGVVAAAFQVRRRPQFISDLFLIRQDVPVAILSLGVFALIAAPLVRFGPGAVERIERLVGRRGGALILAAAILVACGAFAGWWLVYQAYPLSQDEFWATFDARIFSRGLLMAPLAPEWRPFVDALQPIWRLEVPGNLGWSSTYLPFNAIFRALFGALGSQALAGPVWAALSIGLVYDLARRFWPERRDAAFVAAILLATSAQLIVIAMSPYAMSAHLALNLAWLWLFLRKARWARAASVLVAFAATGLHQFVFHPLFAAPFILQLWLTRRWGLAGFYTAAYAAICLFWVFWWPLVFAIQGLPASAAHAAATGASAEALYLAFKPIGLPLMAENLLRFMLWQNPLATPLAMLAAAAAWKDPKGPMAPLAGGLILSILFLTAITPYQGHGWGYRYLHGYLGSLCLLAASAWVAVTGGEGGGAVSAPIRARAWAALMVSTVAAACVWLPLRLVQVHGFIQPYARSLAAMRNAPADVVVVDTAGLWFANDLVRNDPFMEIRPKILHRYLLNDAMMKGLCAHYRVAYFTPRLGADLGIMTDSGREPRSADARLHLKPPSCAVPVTAP